VTVALVLVAVLAVGCVVLVALPFLRDPALSVDEDRLSAGGKREQRLLLLAEDRDRALAALKELEADHRAGRIDDADYRASVGPLRREVATALRALDAERAGTSEHEPKSV
jgi:hypothetical protein